MLDSINHMTLKITSKSHFCSKNGICFHYVRNVAMGVITFPENL